MKKAKQTLSLLLVLIFLLGLLPGAALAGDTPAASVTLNKRTLELTVGGTETLNATVEPKNHTDTVYWVSDDTKVVTVSDGLVTAVGAGSTNVKAAAGAFSDTCTVTVNAAKNTLNFSTNLNAEYTTKSGSPFRLSVAVGSYTPAGGEATPLPAGTAITYQWYKSTDDQIDASDSKVYTQQNYAFSPAAGKNWYYVTATATIEGIEYTGTSNVACVKVPAAAKSVKVTVNNQGILGSDKDGVAVGGKSVSVADVNCDNKQTVDEVLLAAHKALLSADAYATSGSEGNLTITKIWNKETENFAVYLNGAKVTDSVDTVAIKAGDVVCISLNSGESDKTDYALTELDVGTNETLHFNYAGSGLWCGVRVNGIKGTTYDYELTHTTYATGSFSIPTTFTVGQTNVISLFVGTKYDSNGSGTIDANDDFDRYDVYNFTVTTLPGVAPITVKNSDNTAITLR